MAVACLVERDVVRVAGPDAAAYLQGQLSQDLDGLGVGASARSFVLQPTGKVDAWVRVTRAADNEYLLDIDGGHGEALVTRLGRFLLRTKADIDALDWQCVAIRGAGAGQAADQAVTTAELRLRTDWPGIEGVDLLGAGVELSHALPAGVELVESATYEALRISSGVPAMGSELTEKTIPAEAGRWVLDASVSFTKGCFTGQELVARIDSRGGNVPRQLRGLVVDDDQLEHPETNGLPVPSPGSAVHVDGNEVGTVTSSARSDALGAALGDVVALAYVGRAVEPPVEATVAWSDGEIPMTVRTLPLNAPQ